MFHLLTSLYTDITQRPRFNVLFLGSADSGKTTLLQVIKSHYIESKPLPSRLVPGRSTEQNKSLLPKTRSTVGQNVLDLPAPPPSSRPLVEPTHPPPVLPDPQEIVSSSTWFSSASKAPSTSKRIPSKALIHIWDLGGDLGLRKIWEKYYAETDAVVYLWDCEKGGNGEGREAEWSVVGQYVDRWN
jgi:GTPase SAR1 family protein